MTLKSLIKSISWKEWLAVAVAAAVVVAVTAVPPLVGYLVGVQRGLEWNGLQVFAPGDFGVYLSYIEQGRSGTPYMANLFTAEPAYPVFNLFWFSVGQLSWLTGYSALVAFHVARSLLILPLLAVAYLALAYFLPRRSERLAGFLMLAFGSGVGLYFAPFFEGSVQTLTGHEWPIDLWVAEANVFTSMSYSPHFAASWLFFIAAALLLAIALKYGRLRYGAVGGAAALVLFSFHPFHAPTLYLVGLLYLSAARKFRTRDDARSWAAYALFVLVSVPAVLYHYLIIRFGDFGRQALEANVCVTPSPWHVAIGFGVLCVLAPVGLWLARRRGAEIRQVLFPAVWIIAAVVLAYSPLTFQRRLLEGLQFPLVVLAAPAAVMVVRSLRSRIPVASALVACAVFLALMLPSSFAAVTRNVDMYLTDEPPIAYFAADRSAALAWIRDNTSPDAAFLSVMPSGYHVAGWATRRVYAGHWVNSGDIRRKLEEARKFFIEMDDVDRVGFMVGNGLQYVFYGPDERTLGELRESGPFERVFRQGDIEIFRLR